MNASVIITAYRSPMTLRRVLTYYLAQVQLPAEIIIAEDGEDLNLRNIVPVKFKRKLRFKHVTQQDKGYRRSTILNKAIAVSEGDYIIISDADCIPHRKFVRDHVRFARPNQYILGARAYVKECITKSFKPTLLRNIYHTLVGNMYPIKVSFRIPLLNWRSGTSPLGANMSFWRKDLVGVNGFNNNFVGWGHEDMELVDRLKNAKIQELFLHQQCVLYHLNHPILSREDSGPNTQIWNESKANDSKWCNNGLDRFLTSPHATYIKTSFEN